MARDQPTLGILFMIGFCLIIPFADAFAKLAGATLPLAMLLLARLSWQGAVMSAVVWGRGRTLRMAPRLFWLTVLRSVLNIAGLASIYASFRFLPLADAIAIAYVMPFILFFLGHYLLGEDVGPRRVIAALVGFAGTLLVVQPSFATVGWPALLPVVGAVVFAVFILVTRIAAQEADPAALQAVSGWISLAVLLPFMALGTGFGIADLAFVWPSGRDWIYLTGIGVFGTVAHFLMVESLAKAPSATVAPIQYLEIPVAAAVGWLFFREFPNGLALVGIVVILCAGLYILWREQAADQPRAPQAAAAEPLAED